MTNKLYTIRLNPSTKQTELLTQLSGAVRWLYNYMISHNKNQYKQIEKIVFRFDMNQVLRGLWSTKKMKYKSAESSEFVVNIDRFAPSSKMYGFNDNLNLKDREWKCDCGETNNGKLSKIGSICVSLKQEILSNGPEATNSLDRW